MDLESRSPHQGVAGPCFLQRPRGGRFLSDSASSWGPQAMSLHLGHLPSCHLSLHLPLLRIFGTVSRAHLAIQEHLILTHTCSIFALKGGTLRLRGLGPGPLGPVPSPKCDQGLTSICVSSGWKGLPWALALPGDFMLSNLPVPMRGSGSCTPAWTEEGQAQRKVRAICPRLPSQWSLWFIAPVCGKKGNGWEAGQQWPGRWGRRLGSQAPPAEAKFTLTASGWPLEGFPGHTSMCMSPLLQGFQPGPHLEGLSWAAALWASPETM